ncbi:ABC transporter permease [Isoptericola halotolerans]|uniref:ABC transporter permease n=1 Tax=Isoptericola halotolerans TaxID=300560 RepID=UPI00388DF7E7
MTTTVQARPSTPSTLRPSRARGAPLRDVATMARREARRSLRSVDGLITAFALPVLIMVVFVVIFGGAISGGSGDYIDYVVPGVLIMCLGMNSATAAVGVAQDMSTGTIDRFKTLPIFSPAVLWGHVIASVVRNLASAVVVVLAALALGFRPDAGPAGWIGFLGFAALAVVTFTWISTVLGLVLSVDSSQSVNMIFLFIPYLSSGFVPVETMPDWLHGFAEHQPFTSIIETVRGLLMGTLEAATLLTALAWLLAFLLASLVSGSVLYGRRTAR